MLNESQLKEKLQALAQNQFCLSENDNLIMLVQKMIDHIGSTDSDLRELIYSTFRTWILDYNLIEQTLLRNLLPIVLDEQHIFYNIGNQKVDSVFTRSFSMLLLPLILINHRSKPFLAETEIRQIKEQLFRYIKSEKDLRGFVNGKGWAHAIAHAADALDDLAQCAEMGKTDLVEILESIRNAVCTHKAVYIDLEDERLVTPTIAIIKRQLFSNLEIANWIEGFTESVLGVDSLMPEGLIVRANVKNFLQSLYFRLRWEKMASNFDSPIDQTLHKINLFVKQEGG